MFGIEAWQKQFLNDLIRAIDGTEANQTVGSIIDSAEILHLAEIEEIFRLPGASIDFGEWGRGYDPNRPIKNYDLYSAIVQFISKKEAGTTLAERSASGGFEAPAEGVDPFLWTFLQGAWATNLSANFDAGDQALHVAEIPTAGRILGAAGAGYNNFQYKLRTGIDPEQAPSTLADATAPNKTSEASNRIAEAIGRDVANSQGGPLPTLIQLGQSDGQDGALELWFYEGSDASVETNKKPGENGFGIDIGGWAGVPFFAQLREARFFERDLLYYEDTAESDPNGSNYNPQLAPTYDPSKKEFKAATTYDVLALLQAYAATARAVVSDTPDVGWWDFTETLWDQFDGGSDYWVQQAGSTANTLAQVLNTGNKANSFIEESYGASYEVSAPWFLRLGGGINWFSYLLAQGVDEFGEISTLFAKGAVRDHNNGAIDETYASSIGTLTLGTFRNDEISTQISNGVGEWLRSSEFNDVIHSGRGDDIIFADGGTDLIDGGVGVDTVRYDEPNFSSGIEIELIDTSFLSGEGINKVSKSHSANVTHNETGDDDFLYGIEKIIATKYKDIVQGANIFRNIDLEVGDGNDEIVIINYVGRDTIKVDTSLDYAATLETFDLTGDAVPPQLEFDGGKGDDIISVDTYEGVILEGGEELKSGTPERAQTTTAAIISDAGGDLSLEQRALVALVEIMASYYQSDFKKAFDLFRSTRSQLSKREGVVKAFIERSVLMFFECDKTIPILEDCISIFMDAGALTSAARVRVALSAELGKSGDYDRAIDVLEQSEDDLLDVANHRIVILSNREAINLLRKQVSQETVGIYENLLVASSSEYTVCVVLNNLMLCHTLLDSAKAASRTAKRLVSFFKSQPKIDDQNLWATRKNLSYFCERFGIDSTPYLEKLRIPELGNIPKHDICRAIDRGERITDPHLTTLTTQSYRPIFLYHWGFELSVLRSAGLERSEL